MERVKRKDNKLWKGSNEKRTNYQKGPKKRGQTMERVKREDNKQ